MSQRRDQQVQITVAVDIREDRPATNVVCGINPCLCCYFFKAPVPEVAVKSIATLQAAKEDVWAPVAIEITNRYTTPVLQHPVGGSGPFVQNIGEIDACLFGRQFAKARL